MPEAMSSIQKLRICVMPIRRIDRSLRLCSTTFSKPLNFMISGFYNKLPKNPKWQASILECRMCNCFSLATSVHSAKETTSSDIT